MIVNFDELVSPIFLVKKESVEVSDGFEEVQIVGADCFNVSFDRALTSFLNDKFLFILNVSMGKGDRFTLTGITDSISYDPENTALILDGEGSHLVWTAEQLGKPVIINVDARDDYTKLSNIYAIYNKPFETKLFYDKGNGIEPFPNLEIYMYEGLGINATKIMINDMYNEELHILSIPKVTGNIFIYPKGSSK